MRAGLLFILYSLLLQGQPASAAVSSLNPPAKVLIIANDLTVEANLQSALTSLTPAPQVDFCQTLTVDIGIQPSLSRCGKNLMDYCQVWDMRLNGNGNTVGQVSYDTLTQVGPSSDKTLYENFLRSGGSLYLLGENSDIHTRNDNLIALLNSWSTNGSIPYPSQYSMGDFDWTIFPPDPLNFATTPNHLTSTSTVGGRHTKWPGFVPLGQTGSGHPLTQKNYNSVDWVGAFAFLPQDTTLGAGRVMVDLDWTSWQNEWAPDPGGMTAWAQNAYTWMGNCYYRFSLAKAASVPPPGEICIGQNFNYVLCISNTGSNPLAASTTLVDTLPGCVSYQSASPSYTSLSGNYITWQVGAVPVSSSVCVTVTVRADSLPPCP